MSNLCNAKRFRLQGRRADLGGMQGTICRLPAWNICLARSPPRAVFDRAPYTPRFAPPKRENAHRHAVGSKIPLTSAIPIKVIAALAG